MEEIKKTAFKKGSDPEKCKLDLQFFRLKSETENSVLNFVKLIVLIPIKIKTHIGITRIFNVILLTSCLKFSMNSKR